VPDLRLRYLKGLNNLSENKEVKKENDEDVKIVDDLDKANVQNEDLRKIFNVLNIDIFKSYYPEYLFRKQQSRRFLVDTNCLMIDLLPGEGSALEYFKQMHRSIDVLKAEQEFTKFQLENHRRKKLLVKEDYGDPDIEKVTLISGNDSNIKKFVAGLDNSSND